MKKYYGKLSSRFRLTYNRFCFCKSFGEFCQIHRTISYDFLLFSFSLDAVEEINRILGPIRMNRFTFSMHFITFPVDFRPYSIFYQDAKTFFFVLEKLPFINSYKSFFSTKSMFSVLFPISYVSIACVLVFKDTPSISGIIIPFAIIDKPALIFSCTD